MYSTCRPSPYRHALQVQLVASPRAGAKFGPRMCARRDHRNDSQPNPRRTACQCIHNDVGARPDLYFTNAIVVFRPYKILIYFNIISNSELRMDPELEA
jgi:hypothetical protein